MASTSAIFLALSLLIHDITLLYESTILEGGQIVTKIVYILSVCRLLRELPIFPKFIWRRYASICFFAETAVALVLLECALAHGWEHLEDYVLQHGDELLARVSAAPSTEWLMCHVCCERPECADVFARLLLKTFSFLLLLVTCLFTIKH